MIFGAPAGLVKLNNASAAFAILGAPAGLGLVKANKPPGALATSGAPTGLVKLNNPPGGLVPISDGPQTKEGLVSASTLLAPEG